MRAVVMRVRWAAVHVAGETVGAIGPGLLALVGVERGDAAHDVEALADKIANLRVFDGAGGPARCVREVSGAVLVVSQFTLLADTRRGRRPDFGRAAPGEEAEPMVDALVARLRTYGLDVQTGRFGAAMQVESVNDGPYTVLVDTRRSLFETTPYGKTPPA